VKSLILGGNGFIGSHLVDKLLAEGDKVRVFDKYPEHFRKPLPGVEYRFGDFGNRGLLAEALEDVDTVFHLISTTLPKTSNDDPAFDVQSNVVETLFLLEQCVARRVKKLVFISSGGTVYGRPRDLPIREDSPTDPECSYGITKLTIEKYLAFFNHLHRLEYVILRPSNPYGERQNPDNIQGAASVFLGKIARGEDIEIWGDGEVVRDYIYIDDLVEGIWRAAGADTRSKIFNLGAGIGCSLNRLVDAIRRVTSRDVKVTYRAKRSFDVPRIYLDISRAREELGWSPTIPLEAGIAKTWKFVQELYRA
jgi:UDP-glucose 4-epimerase